MLKKSKQRDGILDLLSKKNYHPTVEEIYSVMKDEFPQIGIATVYRNIDQLIQMERIIKIEVSGSPARYDSELMKHYHVRCTECGRIDDVHINLDLEDYIDLETAVPEFILWEYKIDFWGICKNCNNNNKHTA